MFPDTFPTSGELQQFVLDAIIPEIDGAIFSPQNVAVIQAQVEEVLLYKNSNISAEIF